MTILPTKVEHEHSRDAIRERLDAGPTHNYLRDWIYGGIDGAVTTLAVVTGVAGAQLSNWVVLVLGFANLFADGFSMAASNYLGTKAEHDDWRRLEHIEYRHIELEPEGEREEVRQIFERKGFTGADLDRIVELVTSNRERWVKTMLTDEYGLPQSIRSTWKAAFSTFSAFLVCGLVPLLPYLFGTKEHSLALSAALTGLVFFAIGSIKSRWSTSSWWRSGLTTFLVGAIAASLAYVVGVFLRTVFGVTTG
ncbi:MAG TPA: VIT1/CCC1 transporter family protein [Pyrinomonadaceae bacterium]|jgi:VIT1/CCC1 family predicted Fe2+/Mn2+ transporter|nr:VIT1/CCC1 transporter family protein [Pyrinomonadaceae bacterium]